MTDRIATATARYEAAMHGVQTGVAFEMGMAPNGGGTSPKHLRVGVNSTMVTDRALAELLIAKGVFSEEEYIEAVANAAEQELARYEALYPGVSFR